MQLQDANAAPLNPAIPDAPGLARRIANESRG